MNNQSDPEAARAGKADALAYAVAFLLAGQMRTLSDRDAALAADLLAYPFRPGVDGVDAPVSPRRAAMIETLEQIGQQALELRQLGRPG